MFFGGGTPSLASPHTVAAVLEAVAQATYLPTHSEVTLEANPTSAPGSKLAAFQAAGVNRLSIGLQVTGLTQLIPEHLAFQCCCSSGHIYLLGKHLLSSSSF